MNDADSNIINLKVEAANLKAIGATFQPPEAILSNVPVTEMSINQLEMELELLKVVHNIFKGSDQFGVPNSMQTVVDMYAARMQDIENEIFERLTLV